MKQILFLILLMAPAGAEDVLSNQCSGSQCVSIAAGDWTDITSAVTGLSGSKLPYYVTGWDKSFYVPGIDAFCSLSSYWEPSSEPNRSWACYSFVENRWWMVDMGSSWHDEYHSEGGHPMGWLNVDPTTSVALGPCCFTGSQASEEIQWGNWQYDFVGNVGIPHMTPTALTHGNSLGTGTYDSVDQLLFGIGGDSANQGNVFYDNNPLHTSGCSSSANYGKNCYNSYDTGAAVSGSGPPSSIIENAIALNTTDKKIYIFGGYYSGAAQNAVYAFTPSTNTWAPVTYTCKDALGGTNCPVGRILPSWAYDANDNIFLMHGGMANQGPPTAGILTDTWVFDPVALTFTQVATAHAPKYNAIQTTLTAGMGTTDTSFTIGVLGNFSAPAVLSIDSEAIYCTTIASTTYSGCTRGYQNSAATTHSPGASVIGGITPIAPNERLVWMPEDDVFMLFVGQGQALGACSGESSSCPRLWAFRYAPGGHAGYRSATYTPTQIAGIGPLNRNEAGFTSAQLQANQSYAMGSALAASGSTVYQLWTETAVNQIGASPGNSWLAHPYAQANASGTASNLGNAYSSMAPDLSGAPVEGFNPSMAVVGGTPWACWDQQNISTADNVQCKGWDGTGWNAGGGIGIVAATAYDAHAKVINNNGIPTILFREQDRTTGNVPYPTYAYVKQWNGSAFTLLGGGKINSAWGANVVDSADIASDGTNPWVVTSEYTPSNSAASPGNGVNFTAPQVYLYKWSGSAWAKYCAASANVTSTDRAFNVAITVLSGVPYVSFVERSDAASTQKLYVRTCNGTSWTTAGSGTLNRDSTTGWAFRAELANDGTNVYAVWTEQGNPQPWVQTLSLSSHYNQKPHLYVAKFSGGAWSAMGGALNADPANGAATHPAIVIVNGNPVVQWGETSPKSLRQMYAKQWNGTDWGAFTALASPPAPTGTSVSGATITNVTIR